jgi:group I intron endonuclease
MKKDLCGIYKITNIINNKSYIGQSINIQARWKSHRRAAKNPQYTLHKAMKEYGIDNFTFEIIELCKLEQLNSLEQKWIQYFNTYYDGYNETIGGDNFGTWARKVNNEDVLNIRKRRLQCENFSDVYNDYSYIAEGTFKDIWQGTTYKEIKPEDFTYNNLEKAKKISKRNVSAKRKNSKMTEKLVLQIRTDKKDGLSRKEGYLKYKEYFSSISSFDGIWYNQRWKDIQP